MGSLHVMHWEMSKKYSKYEHQTNSGLRLAFLTINYGRLQSFENNWGTDRIKIEIRRGSPI